MKKALLIILLSRPAFGLMLQPGVWTMHDFHLFRQYEFDLCAKEFVFPCRWARDSSLGFGQPMFVFYGQSPYWLGQLFVFSGFQIIDSVKITFILSLVLSGLAMFLLARNFWGDKGALISALFYIYAPYRAVDVWVRGALPEALAFIFFPLILYFLETKRYLLLSGSLALLLITHNLSLYMFLPFLGLWWLLRSRDLKVIHSGLLALLLSAFYWLPVVVEGSWINLSSTTQNYYTYAHHFTSLFQLFISRAWGFGGSVWGPNDTMSFSVGHLHWLVPLLILSIMLLKKTSKKILYLISYFLFLALFALFLTHGKSEILWKIIPGMSFVQFPWRFLTMAGLFLALAAGTVIHLTKNTLVLSALLITLVLINGQFFRPDIWRGVDDRQQFSQSL